MSASRLRDAWEGAALPSGAQHPAPGSGAQPPWIQHPREQRWDVGTSGLRWEASAQSPKRVPSLASEGRGQRDLSSFPVCTCIFFHSSRKANILRPGR